MSQAATDKRRDQFESFNIAVVSRIMSQAVRSLAAVLISNVGSSYPATVSEPILSRRIAKMNDIRGKNTLANRPGTRSRQVCASNTRCNRFTNGRARSCAIKNPTMITATSISVLVLVTTSTKWCQIDATHDIRNLGSIYFSINLILSRSSKKTVSSLIVG